MTQNTLNPRGIASTLEFSLSREQYTARWSALSALFPTAKDTMSNNTSERSHSDGDSTSTLDDSGHYRHDDDSFNRSFARAGPCEKNDPLSSTSCHERSFGEGTRIRVPRDINEFEYLRFLRSHASSK
jgi:hypothetical protein